MHSLPLTINIIEDLGINIHRRDPLLRFMSPKRRGHKISDQLILLHTSIKMLQSLPNELICDILYFLPPQDLARLYINSFNRLISFCVLNQWKLLGIIGLDWALRIGNKTMIWVSLYSDTLGKLQCKRKAMLLLKKATLLGDLDIVRAVLELITLSALSIEQISKIVDNSFFHVTNYGPCNILTPYMVQYYIYPLYILKGATGSEEKDKIALFLDRSEIGNILVKFAARSGNKHHTVSLLNSHPNYSIDDYLCAVRGAIDKGHLHICIHVVEKYVVPKYDVKVKIWNDFANKAAWNGYWDIYDYFIVKGADCWCKTVYSDSVNVKLKDLLT